MRFCARLTRQGLAGIQGNPGPQGIQGIQGTTGGRGNSVLNGTASPTAAIGIDGDFYLNKTTNVLFGPKALGTWPATGQSLTGPQGPAGAQGNPGIQGIQGIPGSSGSRGNSVLNGTGAPAAAIGADGDFYLNTATNVLFGPKVAGAWPPAGQSLVGPQGQAGVQGIQGIPGATGGRGNSVLNGNASPIASIGIDGDFYLNITTNILFGPKASGTWPTLGQSLTGPQGTAGSQGIPGPQGTAGTDGARGNSVLHGTGAPSAAIGLDGDFYLDTAASALFGPKAAGAWPATGQILFGAQGNPGLQGPPGPQGPAGPPTLRIQPQGDLPMGVFTLGAQP